MFNKKKENLNPDKTQMIEWDIRYIRQQIAELDSQLRFGYITPKEYNVQLEKLEEKVNDIEFIINDLKARGELDG